MEKELRCVLNEILEHTSDCDYNRNAHFKQYNYYREKDAKFMMAQTLSLIVTMGLYILFLVDTGNENNFILDFMRNKVAKDLILAIASVITIAISVIGSNYNYRELAQHQWLAAQGYQQLYRRCQFFYEHNIQNLDYKIVSSIAREIGDELSILNMQSPPIDSCFYEDVSNELKNKKYPLKVFIEECENQGKEFHEIITYILETNYKGSLVTVYLYGTAIESDIAKDVDLAIIYSDKCDEEEIRKSAAKVQYECLQ